MRRLTVLALVLAVAMSSWRAAGAEPRDELVVQVERVAALIARRLGSARRAHDAPAIACLDDKLSRTHAALGEVRGHASPGNARAPAAEPAGEARRIGRVRRAIRARVRDLQRRAENCVSR